MSPPGSDGQLERLLAEDAALVTLLELVRERMAADAAHDEGHLLRVARWTLRLAGDEVDARLAVAAALLHDVVNVKKTGPRRGAASERSADVAREVLPGLGFSPLEAEAVAEAVRDHSFSRGATPTTALGRALQDADRLEALGALGAFRCIATGVELGASFFHPEDPWATRRELDDARYSVDHFFAKLLRLPDTMQTDAGRQEARRRAAFMAALLSELGDELDAPPPPERLPAHARGDSERAEPRPPSSTPRAPGRRSEA